MGHGSYHKTNSDSAVDQPWDTIAPLKPTVALTMIFIRQIVRIIFIFLASYISGDLDAPTNDIVFNFGLTNFADLGRGYVTISQAFFVEGWAAIMYMLEDATDSI